MSDQAYPQLMLKHLPAIYQEQPALAPFLRPFESLLLGGAARLPFDPPGLRESILSLPRLLDPAQTPEEFLPWLASWVALALRGDLPAERKRTLIAQASSLYAWRGTRKGLHDLLTIVTGNGLPAITEPEVVTLTVGVQAVIGSTTRLGRDLPYFFEVAVTFPDPEPEEANKRATIESLVRDTIDLGKPAHTYYKLHLMFADSSRERLASRRGRKHAGEGTGSDADAPAKQ